MELIVKESPIQKPEQVSLKTEAKPEQRQFKADKVKLSDNIRAFDKKPRVYTQNPYSFNSVAKKSPVISPTANDMIATPLYNEVGKSLGIDTLHEWGMNYDKVSEIVELAKERSKIEDPQKLSSWIYQLLNTAPALGGKRVNDILVYLKMGGNIKPKTITKTVVKKVIKYIKPKQTTEQFAKAWMEKAWKV